MTGARQGPLIPYRGPEARPGALKLLCFHHAGGGASSFRPWLAARSDCDVLAVQLPGREGRIKETPFRSIPLAVRGLADEIAPWIEGSRYAFFGYSMGALVAFELAREMRRRHLSPPAAVVVAAARAPHLPRDTITFHQSSDQDLVVFLRDLGATPEDVLRSSELMALMLPTIRADLQMVETFEYVSDAPLDSALVAFGGNADPHVSEAQLRAWSIHTRSSFHAEFVAGGHFFLGPERDRLLARIVAASTAP